MTTTYRVTRRNGEILGIFPKTERTAAYALAGATPGASVKPVVSIDNPCATHPAFEADNCPSCGTSRMSF